MTISCADTVGADRPPILEVRNIVKKFGDVVAAAGVSFHVQPGEFFTVLGPSGSGKTTLLRMIGGLESFDEGELILEGGVIASQSRGIFVPPERRNMGMVFQSYAIWPHMTVFENVAYPLRLRKLPKRVVEEKVMEALRLTKIQDFASRSALLLSGGEQQRVALARALVYSPKVLLLDEPLSNLDAKLREQMRVELKMLQRMVGFTAVFVTHDQVEAMALSDRVMIMNKGRCEQIGSPQEVYEVPSSPFVRDFVGRMVTLRGVIVKYLDSGRLEVKFSGGCTTALGTHNKQDWVEPGSEVVVAVRPEEVAVRIEPDDQGINVEAEVEALLFLGSDNECRLRIGNQTVNLYTSRFIPLEVGQRIYMIWEPGREKIWPG